MKIKAIRKAYYNDRIIEVGEILDVKLEKVPSWATLAGGKETKKEEKKEEVKIPSEAEKKTEVVGGVQIPEGDIVEDENANNADKLAELDALITKGVELNISIDTENKTIQQQIDELNEKISEAEKK